MKGGRKKGWGAGAHLSSETEPVMKTDRKQTENSVIRASLYVFGFLIGPTCVAFHSSLPEASKFMDPWVLILLSTDINVWGNSERKPYLTL